MLKRALIFATALLAAACGPSAEGVFLKYRPAYAALRADLMELAKLLPPPGAAGEPGTKQFLDPAPAFDETSGKDDNVEILMEPQLSDPEADDAKVGFDLRLAGGMLDGLRRTGPGVGIDSVEGDAAALGTDLLRGLAHRWIVACRAVRHDPPVATDEEHFEPGSIDLEAFLLDRKEKKVVLSFRFATRTDESVGFVYRGDGDKRERLEAWVRSNLWENARKELFRTSLRNCHGIGDRRERAAAPDPARSDEE